MREIEDSILRFDWSKQVHDFVSISQDEEVDSNVSPFCISNVYKFVVFIDESKKGLYVCPSSLVVKHETDGPFSKEAATAVRLLTHLAHSVVLHEDEQYVIVVGSRGLECGRLTGGFPYYECLETWDCPDGLVVERAQWYSSPRHHRVVVALKHSDDNPQRVMYMSNDITDVKVVWDLLPEIKSVQAFDMFESSDCGGSDMCVVCTDSSNTVFIGKSEREGSPFEFTPFDIPLPKSDGGDHEVPTFACIKHLGDDTIGVMFEFPISDPDFSSTANTSLQLYQLDTIQTKLNPIDCIWNPVILTYDSGRQHPLPKPHVKMKYFSSLGLLMVYSYSSSSATFYSCNPQLTGLEEWAVVIPPETSQVEARSADESLFLMDLGFLFFDICILDQHCYLMGLQGDGLLQIKRFQVFPDLLNLIKHYDAPPHALPSSPCAEEPQKLHLEEPQIKPAGEPQMLPPKAPQMVPPEAPQRLPSEAPQMLPPKAPEMLPPEAPQMVPPEAPQIVPLEAPQMLLLEEPQTLRPGEPQMSPDEQVSSFQLCSSPASISESGDEVSKSCADICDMYEMVGAASPSETSSKLIDKVIHSLSPKEKDCVLEVLQKTESEVCLIESTMPRALQDANIIMEMGGPLIERVSESLVSTAELSRSGPLAEGLNHCEKAVHGLCQDMDTCNDEVNQLRECVWALSDLNETIPHNYPSNFTYFSDCLNGTLSCVPHPPRVLKLSREPGSVSDCLAKATSIFTKMSRIEKTILKETETQLHVSRATQVVKQPMSARRPLISLAAALQGHQPTSNKATDTQPLATTPNSRDVPLSLLESIESTRVTEATGIFTGSIPPIPSKTSVENLKEVASRLRNLYDGVQSLCARTTELEVILRQRIRVTRVHETAGGTAQSENMETPVPKSEKKPPRVDWQLPQSPRALPLSSLGSTCDDSIEQLEKDVFQGYLWRKKLVHLRDTLNSSSKQSNPHLSNDVVGPVKVNGSSNVDSIGGIVESLNASLKESLTASTRGYLTAVTQATDLAKEEEKLVQLQQRSTAPPESSTTKPSDQVDRKDTSPIVPTSGQPQHTQTIGLKQENEPTSILSPPQPEVTREERHELTGFNLPPTLEGTFSQLTFGNPSPQSAELDSQKADEDLSMLSVKQIESTIMSDTSPQQPPPVTESPLTSLFNFPKPNVSAAPPIASSFGPSFERKTYEFGFGSSSSQQHNEPVQQQHQPPIQPQQSAWSSSFGMTTNASAFQLPLLQPGVSPFAQNSLNADTNAWRNNAWGTQSGEAPHVLGLGNPTATPAPASSAVPKFRSVDKTL